MTLLLFACLMSLHISFLWARFAYFRIDGPTGPPESAASEWLRDRCKRSNGKG